jgi:hypothetical protein
MGKRRKKKKLERLAFVGQTGPNGDGTFAVQIALEFADGHREVVLGPFGAFESREAAGQVSEKVIKGIEEEIRKTGHMHSSSYQKIGTN